MQYRPLGQTGLTVSIMGFGTAPLGNEYGELEAKTGIRAIHAAIERGINFFDTSPMYGRSLSEERLGKALKGKREQIVLATKGGWSDPEHFDFSPQNLRQSLEDSLVRLKTDVIDIYQLHDIEFISSDQILNETLPTIAQFRDEGKIRFIGITAYPLPMLGEVAAQWPVDTILSYCHYNLLNTTLADSLLPFAKENGIALINASSLHMGMLTEQGAPSWHPAPLKVHKASQKAAAILRERGSNITELALQFALSNQDISSTLVGMSSEEEVIQNASLVGTEPDEALLAAVRPVFSPVKDLNWQVGLPENHEPDAVSDSPFNI